MPLLILFLLILFPSMEVYLLFSWIGESTVIALLYLIATMLAGVFCMRLAKAGLGELLPQMRQMRGGGEARMLLLLGKLWFVGALLFFPGYLTDIFALCLLLFVRGKPQPPAENEVVEVRGRILDD